MPIDIEQGRLCPGCSGSAGRSYTSNLGTLAAHLREAAQVGDIAPLSPAQIEVEVRLITAMLDGIGLQWLLDPATDLRSCVTTCVERAIAAWKAGDVQH